jgi:hypothetical protein
MGQRLSFWILGLERVWYVLGDAYYGSRKLKSIFSFDFERLKTKQI